MGRDGLRGGFEGDFEAEGFKLADVVASLTRRVGAGVVEVGPEVVEADLGVGQQVPDETVKGNQPTLHRQLRELPWRAVDVAHRATSREPVRFSV